MKLILNQPASREVISSIFGFISEQEKNAENAERLLKESTWEEEERFGARNAKDKSKIQNANLKMKI
jgi:hypothetical protein